MMKKLSVPGFRSSSISKPKRFRAEPRIVYYVDHVITGVVRDSRFYATSYWKPNKTFANFDRHLFNIALKGPQKLGLRRIKHIPKNGYIWYHFFCLKGKIIGVSCKDFDFPF